MTQPTSILVIDDEHDIRQQLCGVLQDADYSVGSCDSSEAARAWLAQHSVSAVILDVWLREGPNDGLHLLKYLRQQYPHLPVIMISGHSTIKMAVEAMQLGAFHFITKPFDIDTILVTVSRAVETAQLKQELQSLKLASQKADDLLGQSAAVESIRQTIQKAAPTNSRILITGPAGSGKEVIARNIHQLSTRAKGPFVVVSCAALTDDHFEHELLGAESDSHRAMPLTAGRLGALERAHHGTLLLDEIGDLSLAVQSKLVRLLQDMRIQRSNQASPQEIDVRIMATSNRDLQQMIVNNQLREDLFYRLNVVQVKTVPLKQRREDIPLLIQAFTKRIAAASKLPDKPISLDAMTMLQGYDWPGNVRQLRNVVEWMLIMASTHESAEITRDMLPPEITQHAAALTMTKDHDLMHLPLREAREAFEKQYLQAQLNRFGGNISRTAEFVGMERSALHRKLRALSEDGETLTAHTSADNSNQAQPAATKKAASSAA